ncbi:MAG: pirin family protein [Alphaproteobacteria bacterium]|nr:pirin family protein [Alphaproteobacteria bacterium]
MAESSILERVQSQTIGLPELKPVAAVQKPPAGHWVGDGFPVRTIFAYDNAAPVSPFLLMDYAGPHQFSPAEQRRGVGEHPHRGFETVTIVYSGEVDHRDSGGGGGRIGPGDVQWMTAGSGVVHEEMHSDDYTRRGGAFEAIQLWVNLPKRLKMTAPRYQTLRAAGIPVVSLPEDAGSARVIAGEFGGAKGPAETFTPMAVWEISLKAGRGAIVPVTAGDNVSLFVLRGEARINGRTPAKHAEFVQFGSGGEVIRLDADSDALVLVLSGEPINEPVFGYGPFVMNTEDEIRAAISDYRSGRMGHLG